MFKQRQKMSNEEKLEQIQKLCNSIIFQWTTGVIENDPYEGGKIVGRSVLAETILEITN